MWNPPPDYESPADWPRRRILLALFILGTLVRAWFLWLPNNDDDLFLQDWARRILNHGLANIYDPEFGRVSAMHPPLNYYLLWASASAYRAFFIPSMEAFDPASIALMVLIKLPNLVVDLLVAFVVYASVRRHVGFRPAAFVLGLYLFNPALIWEAGFVGQIESVQTLPVLLAVLLLAAGRVELSWASMTLGVLAKPQGLVVVPLIVLFGALTSPARRIGRALVLSTAVALVVLLPWIAAGRVSDVARVYERTVDTYPFLTLNAANAWGLATAIRYPGFGIGSGDGSDTLLIPDSQPVRGWPTVSYKQLGLLMFAGAYGFGLWCVSRRRDGQMLVLAAAFVSFAFYMLPTQITERYLFPVFPLLATVLAGSAWLLGAFLGASATFLLNLYLVFPLPAVLPWNVVSNQKEPLAHEYLSVPDPYRAPLTLLLCVINVCLFLVLAGVVYRRSLAGSRQARAQASGRVVPPGEVEGPARDVPLVRP